LRLRGDQRAEGDPAAARRAGGARRGRDAGRRGDGRADPGVLEGEGAARRQLPHRGDLRRGQGQAAHDPGADAVYFRLTKPMSFQKFIYYCAVCGGWGAFLAWAVVQAAGVWAVSSEVLQALLTGGLLGGFVAAGVGFVDAALNAAGAQRLMRVLVCAGV